MGVPTPKDGAAAAGEGASAAVGAAMLTVLRTLEGFSATLRRPGGTDDGVRSAH